MFLGLVSGLVGRGDGMFDEGGKAIQVEEEGPGLQSESSEVFSE